MTQENWKVFRLDTPPIDLEMTLLCGQAFRWDKIDSQAILKPDIPAFLGVLDEYPLILAQENPLSKQLIVGIQEWDHEKALREILPSYLSMQDDIGKIQEILGEKDDVMKDAISWAKGLRILTQDPWESLVSYLISVNNNIPRIKGIIARLCECHGKRIGISQYSFPSAKAVHSGGTLEALRCGFRHRFLSDAASKVANKDIDLDSLYHLPTDAAREKLMSIKGVGPKVADCVLLFAYHRLEVFPVDVWVKRAISNLYMGGADVTPKKAREEGARRFKNFAGYAQEYLFIYEREKSARLNAGG